MARLLRPMNGSKLSEADRDDSGDAGPYVRR